MYVSVFNLDSAEEGEADFGTGLEVYNSIYISSTALR